MKTHLFYFFAAFAVGCGAALAARAAWFKPYVDPTAHAVAPEYAPMVTNPAAPAADLHANHQATETPAAQAAPPPASGTDAHALHDAATTRSTVNDRCTICGMDVDPSIPPVSYQGKLVGFGCRLCPPQFAADPDRYGPTALENKVLSP